MSKKKPNYFLSIFENSTSKITIAPVMDDAVNDLRAAIEEEVKKNNVTRTYSSVSHQGKSYS